MKDTGDELQGMRFKDNRNITHRVIHGADILTACDLRYNMIPKIGLRKRGDVDCMVCPVKDR
jgi:hypothetical protein